MLFKLCALVVLGMLALAGMATHLVTGGAHDWWWCSRAELRQRMDEAHERALEAREMVRERMWDERQRARDRMREVREQREMLREQIREQRQAIRDAQRQFRHDADSIF